MFRLFNNPSPFIVFIADRSKTVGVAINASKVVVQNMALASVQLPIIGAVAVLMVQLIDLCDAYKCNMTLFFALKTRMQFMYRLYFAEGGKFNTSSPFSFKKRDN